MQARLIKSLATGARTQVSSPSLLARGQDVRAESDKLLIRWFVPLATSPHPEVIQESPATCHSLAYKKTLTTLEIPSVLEAVYQGRGAEPKYICIICYSHIYIFFNKARGFNLHRVTQRSKMIPDDYNRIKSEGTLMSVKEPESSSVAGDKQPVVMAKEPVSLEYSFCGEILTVFCVSWFLPISWV